MRNRERADGNDADGPHGLRRSVDGHRPRGVSPLRDSYGRVADDLRISITDRCNFRCIYCMPAEGLKWLKRDDILRFEEIVRLARIFVERYGVRTIRITGGEPLVRIKVEELVGMINAIDPTLDITMTTNGVLLRDKARLLKEAGLKRINISLDTVSYTHLTLPTIYSV